MNTLLHISNLTKRYGAVSALEQISIAIERASVLAVLGPNGAGKSTLFGCLLGLTLLSGGESRFASTPARDRDRTSIGYLPERVSLYPHRTVWENAVFFAGLKGYPPEAIRFQLERVGLGRVHHRKARELSKGMLQRLGLAIALCGAPELLILDEPFNGLDPAVLDRLQAILREEHERGATLLISTHTISAVEPLATHALILLNGSPAAFGPVDALRAEYRHSATLEELYQHVARAHAHNAEVLA